jgi:subtilisin family serine protease
MNFILKIISLLILTIIVHQIQAGEASSQGIVLHDFESRGNGKLPSKQVVAKVDGDLLALHGEYMAYLKRTSLRKTLGQVFQPLNPLVRSSLGSVVIEAVASGDPDLLAEDLRKLDVQKITVFGRMISGRLPLTVIPELKNISSLHFIRPAYAVTNVGTVTSQGDVAMLSDLARTAFNIDGAGVTVGVLSDSYDCLEGASNGVNNADLPAGISVLAENSDCLYATDEGRAMMEIIHDVAPGAALAFHTAFEGQANFAQGILDLAKAGAKVITDDSIYFAEPFYQDGIIAQAVDTVKTMGVAYFSAAGNANRKAYESEFRPSGKYIDFGFGPEEMHDFNPGAGSDICQKITIPLGATLILDFQWDEPFFSVSGAPGSASDMDILLATNAACTRGFYWASPNTGRDPIEVIGYTNMGPGTTFGLMIAHNEGPTPGLMKMVNLGSNSITFNQYDTKSATSFGHNAASGGLGVGAADYRKTPRFGLKTPVVQRYSSAGGIPILFDTDGNRLATPEIRQQPAITAPDGVNTSFFGVDTNDKDTYPNFFGTSAAAPHAAGVAALLMDIDPTLTPDETYAWMKANSLDMNDPDTRGFDKGFDYRTGYGLIQAVADFAVVKISAPAAVKGTLAASKTVIVTIQNRSPYNETITTEDLGDGKTNGLVHLTINVVDDDGEDCALPLIALDSAKTLKNDIKILKPKQTLSIVYNVIYHCAKAQKISNDLTIGDYIHNASVYHEALDEIPDAHKDDDMCPRSVVAPFEVDPLPDGTIKDKGCGARKTDKTFGDPIVTNVSPK